MLAATVLQEQVCLQASFNMVDPSLHSSERVYRYRVVGGRHFPGPQIQRMAERVFASSDTRRQTRRSQTHSDNLRNLPKKTPSYPVIDH